MDDFEMKRHMLSETCI